MGASRGSRALRALDFLIPSRVRASRGAAIGSARIAVIFLLACAATCSILQINSVVAPAHASVDPDECKKWGGKAECTELQIGDYTYQGIDETQANGADPVRDFCSCQAFGCGTSFVTEANMSDRAHQFEQCIPSHGLCSGSAPLYSDWNAPIYQYGIEVQNTRIYRSAGNTVQSDGTCNVPNWADFQDQKRFRTVACPEGYAVRASPVPNKYICWKKPAQACPECSDPVRMTDGTLVVRETDYRGPGPQPLFLERTYLVGGYYHAIGTSSERQPMLGHFWYTNYDARIDAVTDSQYEIAVAVRPDGSIKEFDLSGNEIAPTGNQPDRIEQIAGGGWRYYGASDTTETYNAQGKLISITNRQGLSQTLTYSDWTTPPEISPWQGLLIQVTDAFGRSLHFTYDIHWRMISMTDPAGNRYSYDYWDAPADSERMLSNVVYPLVGQQVSARKYWYDRSDHPHLLTRIDDELHQTVANYGVSALTNQWAYTNSVVLGGGRESFSFSTDLANYMTMTDALNTTTTFSIGLVNGVRKITAVSQRCVECGDAASTLFDANGFISRKTDFNGNVTTYVHNSIGEETSRTEAYETALARTIATQWHSTFRLPIQIDEPGRRTVYGYDGNGNKLSETVTDTVSGESRATAWTYNSSGQVLTVDGPRTDVSDVTTYTYDGQGNLATVTDALGHLTQYSNYDGNGNPGQITDPNGVITTMTYDARGRLHTRTVAGATTTFDYEVRSLLAKTTLPDGSYVRNTYDAARRLTDVTDNLGNTIHYTLDGFGNRTRTDIKDPAGNLKRTMSQVFNGLGRLTEVHGANGQVTVYGYDAQGNRTTETQQTGAGNFTTTTTYDALNRAKTVTDAATGITTYGYNPLSQLTSVQDPTNLTTSYAYNALGDLETLTSPDTGMTTYMYDSGGNRASQTDARGVTVNYSYDVLNRPTALDYPGPAEDVSYFYDGTGAIGSGAANGVGRLTGVRDESGTTAYSYTARGQLASEVDTISNVTYTTSYGYDSADRLTGETYPSGRALTYSRDSLGRVSGVSTTAAASTATLASSISYLPFGPATGWTLGNGVTVTHSYDQDYRLTNYTDGGILNRTLAYDARNLITGITDNLSSASSQTLTYDSLARLATASGVYGALSWTYNGIGDRLTEVRGTTTDTYAYATGTHRLSGITGGHTVSFGYDAAGNTTSKNTLALTYNNANRLSSATHSSTTEQNTYNAKGQRAKKIVGGVETRFIHDRDGNILTEFSTQQLSETNIDYIWLDGKPLAEFSTLTRHEVIVDNSDAGFSTIGAWGTASATGQYGSSYAKRGPAVELPGGTIVDDRDSGASFSGAWIAGGNCGALCPDALHSILSVEEPYGGTYFRSASLDAPSIVPSPMQDGSIYAPPIDTDGSFTVSWGAPIERVQTICKPIPFSSCQGDRVAGYALQVANNADFQGARTIYDGPALSFAVSNFIPGTYFFRVKAHMLVCRSAWLEQNCNSPGDYNEPADTGYYTVGPNVTAVRDVSPAPKFRWDVPLSGAGRYRVHVRWVPLRDSASVTYAVAHAAGTTSYPVNQSTSSMGWYSLGSQAFGSTASIVLTPYPGVTAVADAVQVIPIEDTDSEVARWAPPDTATYDVYVRWPSAAGASSHAPFSVTDGSGTTSLAEDQSATTGQWNLLGTFTFSNTSTQGVTLKTDWDATVLADAVRFVPSGSGATSSSSAFFHTDHLGTPQKLTGSSGTVVWDASYEPFGAATISTAIATNPLRFPGQYFDAETGLSQNWHRDYDSSIGRYVESDLVGLAGGLSSYSYVMQDPMGRADPLGLKPYIFRITSRLTLTAFGIAASVFNLAVDDPLKGQTCNYTVTCGGVGRSFLTRRGIAPEGGGSAGSHHFNWDDGKKCGDCRQFSGWGSSGSFAAQIGFAGGTVADWIDVPNGPFIDFGPHVSPTSVEVGGQISACRFAMH